MMDPGTYARCGPCSRGSRPSPSARSRVGTQQFITLDITLEVGAVQETITVTGASPLIETSNASTGHGAQRRDPADPPVAWTRGVPHRHDGADRSASGDTQYNRQQDQTNSALLSLGGGPRRGNNYTLDGVPITDILNRASAKPVDRSARRRQGAGAHLRRRNGSHGRRRVQHDHKSGTNAYRGTGFFQMRPIWGQANNYFSRKATGVAIGDGGGEAGKCVLPRRRRSRRPDRAEPHVLLVRERGLPRRPDAQ